MTKQQLQYDLQNNRPVAIHYDTHTVCGYGLIDNNVYIHDPGNGSVIHDYTDMVNGTFGVRQWSYTTRVTTSATACPIIQTIMGNLNSTGQVLTTNYKATQTINATCGIIDSSNVSFISGGNVNLQSGFNVQLGSSLTILTGQTLSCP